MNKLLILLIGAFLFSCNQENKPESHQTTTEEAAIVTQGEASENFDWLVGHWKRVSTEEGKETFEHWKKETAQTFWGHGFTMQNADTVWQEKMVLRKIDATWTLKVETPGNDDLVAFKLTQYTPNAFTVENPMHDFPQKIKYWKHNEQLQATVSAGSTEIKFTFEQIN